MSGHTKGPWVVSAAGSAKAGEPFRITEIYVYAPDTQDDTAICADVIDPVTQEPSEANARLIAAAPDLLVALQDLADKADALIAHLKATGRMRECFNWPALADARTTIAKVVA